MQVIKNKRYTVWLRRTSLAKLLLNVLNILAYFYFIVLYIRRPKFLFRTDLRRRLQSASAKWV